MKIFLATWPQAKDQIEALNKRNVKNRLFSYYFIDKQLKNNRKKIVSKKVHERWNRKK
ncbi:MAG: hypothetical protein K9L75_02670 [Spirochaetia bacterium]|nr:hypothetical protein [Spirochaetia bacterium]